MIYDVFKQYFEFEDMSHLTELRTDVMFMPDYFMDLYAAGRQWYVVVEADYLDVGSVPHDIEMTFPVKVKGWCKLRDYQKKTGKELLPPNSFKVQSVNESDEEWNNYHGVIYKGKMSFALLLVEPKQGVSVDNLLTLLKV